MDHDPQIAQLLREIRDHQREALALQREHIVAFKAQVERVERLNERAESLQGRAGKAVKALLWVVLPLLALVLLLMAWPYARYMFG
ncbi:MAG TPA: hypothetical protein PLI83_05970 [Thermomonas sp.]|jgi:ABC-type uncharacterized transport system involved in gliding motility auxiliary subunit|uniref:hypothetical protein n=1 Tax=Thermomonas sp. TaxID=1971895 RepID=UPI002C648D79|nr:hypothetical protein [Thermomonas sp.]HPM57550.1 hypothetical protein [Thermomonas sp.]